MAYGVRMHQPHKFAMALLAVVCAVGAFHGCATSSPPPTEPPVVAGPSAEEFAREQERQRVAQEQARRRAALVDERRSVDTEISLRVKNAYGKEAPDYETVDILYATDRASTGKDNATLLYGPDRGPLQMGLYAVAMPRELRRDPLSFRAVIRSKSPEEFWINLQDRLTVAKRKDILVFVHGYYVTFDEAARRTAQVAYALGFPGVAITYSWPSQGALTGYLADETNIEWTVPHFREFLKRVATQSGAERVHVIAHSMGNRAVTSALRQLAADPQKPGAPLIQDLVLIAPDMDADIFRDAIPEIRPVVSRVTLYTSSQDKALLISKTVHGYQRAGDTKPAIVVVPGVDTIDASSVDTSLTGHSYYSDSRSVLVDLFSLLRHGAPPDERFGLLAKEQAGLRYWTFQP